ncbi:MAG: hypothetical protein FJY76_01945, partial [Candidatus Aenigmarchaeota archaeon]|nr:hypothetical protein [Candidatus Aenigmarchaeota archaeon]
MSHLELPGGKNYQLDGDDGICIGLSKPVEGGAARITFGKDEHVPTKYLRIYRTAGKWIVHRLRGAPAVTVDEKHELSEGSYMPI